MKYGIELEINCFLNMHEVYCIMFYFVHEDLLNGT